MRIMRTSVFRSVVLFMTLLLSSAYSFAYDVKIDGIYYFIFWWDKTAEVTYNDKYYSAYEPANYYSGKVVIPETIVVDGVTYTVTSIGKSAFAGFDGLTSVVIPNTVTDICERAFYGSRRIQNLVIPSSVQSIEPDAFYGIGSISVDSNNPFLTMEDNVLFNKDKTELVASFNGRATYNIPESVNRICKAAFRYCSYLKTISIPNSVTTIDDEAFYYCSGIASISIPNSVTKLGSGVFMYCTSLKSVDIPNSVTDINTDGLFYECNNLTSVTLPNSLTSIGVRAFYFCKSLTSINIPNSVNSIGVSAFEGCSNLESINIPSSVTSIGGSAFDGCKSLTSINIPSSVTFIESSFDYSGLKTVIISNSETKFSYRAFCDCGSLRDVYCLCATPPTINYKDVFNYATKYEGTLHVPIGCKDAYANATEWKDFSRIVEDNSLPTSIQNVDASLGNASDEKIYDLSGKEITAPRAGQIVIKKQGGKTVKCKM